MWRFCRKTRKTSKSVFTFLIQCFWYKSLTSLSNNSVLLIKRLNKWDYFRIFLNIFMTNQTVSIISSHQVSHQVAFRKCLKQVALEFVLVCWCITVTINEVREKKNKCCKSQEWEMWNRNPVTPVWALSHSLIVCVAQTQTAVWLYAAQF